MLVKLTPTELELLADAVNTHILDLEVMGYHGPLIVEYRNLYRRLMFELNKLES